MPTLQLDLFVLRKPVDDGLADLLRHLAASTESVEEEMRVGDMHISDWSLFERPPHPLIAKQGEELGGITAMLLRRPVQIYESWFHICHPGSAFKRHRHIHSPSEAPTAFSLVYYVDRRDPNGSGQLRIHDPDIVLSPESGMIVIFPAHVEHEVLEYRGAAERIIIAANLRFAAPGPGPG